jgi:hypothetical protein
MAAQVQVVEVDSAAELDSAITSWVVQGYVLANRTPVSATMVKKKEFNLLWAVIGFLICILPLLIYLIVYAGETDKVVEIRVRSGAPSGDNLAELERMKELLDRNVITEAEYEAEKKRLLEQ